MSQCRKASNTFGSANVRGLALRPRRCEASFHGVLDIRHAILEASAGAHTRAKGGGAEVVRHHSSIATAARARRGAMRFGLTLGSQHAWFPIRPMTASSGCGQRRVGAQAVCACMHSQRNAISPMTSRPRLRCVAHSTCTLAHAAHVAVRPRQRAATQQAPAQVERVPQSEQHRMQQARRTGTWRGSRRPPRTSAPCGTCRGQSPARTAAHLRLALAAAACAL